MSDIPEDAAIQKTATQILAELVARRKAAGTRHPGATGRESERAAG